MPDGETHLGTTFKTPIRHVFGEALLVAITVPVILLVGLAPAALCGYLANLAIPDSVLADSPTLELCVAVPAYLLVCSFAWLWAKHRLKFTLRISQGILSYGKSPFRETIPFTDVTSIQEKAEMIDSPGSYRVVVTAPGKKWICFFGVRSGDCASALRRVCSNAVFVDAAGKEHLPERTHSPVAAIRNLIHSRYTRATAAILLSVPCLAWSLVILWAVVTKMKEGVTLPDAVEGMPIGFLSIPFLGIISLATAVHLWRKAFRLSKRLKAQMKLGIVHLTSETPIDLANSGIEKI